MWWSLPSSLFFLPFLQCLTQNFAQSRHLRKPLQWMDESESWTWVGPVVSSLSHMWRFIILWACPKSYISIQTHCPSHKSTLDTGEHASAHSHQCMRVIPVPSSAGIYLLCTPNWQPSPKSMPMASHTLHTEHTSRDTCELLQTSTCAHVCCMNVHTWPACTQVCLELKRRVRKHLEPGLCGIHNISQENIPVPSGDCRSAWML